MNEWKCNHAPSGCNYPEGECVGLCLSEQVPESHALNHGGRIGLEMRRLVGPVSMFVAMDEARKRAARAVAPQQPDDEAVDRFAQAMKHKLAQARDKGRTGWQQMNPADLSAMLYGHVEKGDPRDVANFCMFLWNLGQPITPCQPVQPAAAINEQLYNALKMVMDDPQSLEGRPRTFECVTEAIAAYEAAKKAGV